MELNLRSDIADPRRPIWLRALLFAEPQILIAWAAGATTGLRSAAAPP
jgi:hypothetical protein